MAHRGHDIDAPVLAAGDGRGVGRSELARRVRRTGLPAAAGAVRSAVERLRRKLGESGHTPAYVVTVPRVGYRIGAPQRPVGS